MLVVIFELGIDWYTNKDKCSSIVNNMFYSDIPIRSPAGQYRYIYCIDHMSSMLQCYLEKYAKCSCDE